MSQSDPPPPLHFERPRGGRLQLPRSRDLPGRSGPGAGPRLQAGCVRSLLSARTPTHSAWTCPLGVTLRHLCFLRGSSSWSSCRPREHDLMAPSPAGKCPWLPLLQTLVAAESTDLKPRWLSPPGLLTMQGHTQHLCGCEVGGIQGLWGCP